VNYLQIAIVIIGALALIAVYVRHRGVRRERSLRHLLDQADALEQLLHQTRQRMGEMRRVVDRVPQDIAAQAHASLDAETQVQQALRNVLEHRLWISKHGLTASQNELDAACAAMDRAHASISDRLSQLESAGAELANVTQAALDQAAREPAALTRRTAED
jgi:Tfp pilus assembly protein PilE